MRNENRKKCKGNKESGKVIIAHQVIYQVIVDFTKKYKFFILRDSTAC